MIAIICVDDHGGMMFNHRRQTKDRVVMERILRLSAGHKLWMNHYSAQEFSESGNPYLNTDDSFISEAQDGEYCFVEGAALKPYEQWIEKIILFKWNKVYAADYFFDIPLEKDGWNLKYSEDFTGNSHDKITMEVYEK